MTKLAWTDCKIKLSDLVPWADNPRMSTKAQARRIIESFVRFGQVEPFAIGPNNEVYDGHQRLGAIALIQGGAHKFGYEAGTLQHSALLVLRNKDTEYSARRSSRELSDTERRELVLALHSATGGWDWNALSGWDTAQMGEWGFDAETLREWNNDANNLKELLKSELPTEDADPQIDMADGLRKKWGVETGQVWQIGDHRIICGDCTDAAVVMEVMQSERAEMVWTDPPYGVAVGDKNKYLNSVSRSNRVDGNLENDTLGEHDLAEMLCKSFDAAIAVCTAGAGWYIAAPPGPLHVLFGKALKDRGIWRQTIQWVKNSSTFSPMGVCYHWQSEPIFFGWLPNASHRYYGGRKQTTVWEIDRPNKSDLHPTMKPVELVVRAIENSSRNGEIVFDPFCGSGTTIIACQNTGRVCRAIEIDPKYVSVCLERFSVAFPGVVIKLCESYGETEET